jgi:signal transduction histidine kinase
MTEQRSAPVRPPQHGGDLRLPTPPGVIRQFWNRHPWVTDSIIAGIYAVPMLIVLSLEGVGAVPETRPTSMIALNLIVVVAMGSALLFRRHAPLAVLAVTWLGLLVSFPDYGQGDVLPVFFALYAVAVYRSVRAAWIGLAISVGVGICGAVIHRSLLEEPWGSVSAQYSVVMLAVTLIGINIGNRKRYVAAIIDRAAQLARERDQQAQLARISERSRIAREMHDIIAHSLSVMVALADGADALAEKDPARSRGAMREVAATGRGSLVEMRRLLGVLADDQETDAAATATNAVAPGNASGAQASGELTSGARSIALQSSQPHASQSPTAPSREPQPGVGQLADLVESFRSAGLPTRLEMTGQMPKNPGIQLTLYRIVQESLTNALRYSLHPSMITVRVNSLQGRLEVVISDDGRQRPSAPSQGSGRGIVGMRERVALYGGTLDAGRSPGGGWRVRATMTTDEESDE